MITITDKAKEKISSILREEDSPYLRFGLQGGGCNGFTYFFSVEKEISEDDLEVEIDESHTLLVDAASNMYLEEAEIDYKKDMMGESFVFNNPNQKTSCGCGSSVGF
jgi:iron-sulfur cluster assembly accessory protein